MRMRVKMQQPAYKCEKMQMRALFVNGPIPVRERLAQLLILVKLLILVNCELLILVKKYQSDEPQ